jgi:hypothetical protein
MVDTNGKVVDVEDMLVDGNRIASFVTAYKREYFEDHSMEWCLEEIISRGIAEIKRQVKTAAKQKENKTAGVLLREFNLTPEMARQLIAQAAEAKRKSEQASQ